MDAQELRNLQEAYLEVYAEALDSEGRAHRSSNGSVDPREVEAAATRARQDETGKYKVRSRSRGNIPAGNRADPRYMENRRKKGIERAAQHQLRRTNPEEAKRQEDEARQRRMRLARTLLSQPKEQYDIILSHLLDEGYAETPEAAEAIMVNMSEEWRDSIIG